jgi:RNA polymerase sigma-70 factor (ECF subfamily)
MTTTPQSLLQRLKAPSPPAADWERFVRLYAPLLHDWALRAGMQEADAADLVQDVLVHLMKKLPEFVYDPSGSFRAWMRTVLLNKYRESLRKVAPLLATVAEPTAAPVEAFEEAEHRKYLLGRALQLMKTDFQENTWRVFWMTTVEGRPVQEVAAELKTTPKAVYLARARVLRRLREELAGLLD